MMNKLSPPPKFLLWTHTRRPNHPPVHNCTAPRVQSLHTEWWLPLSPAFVQLLWEEQFTESIIDFCHNRYRDASPSLLSRFTPRITTVRPVCEAPSLFFFHVNPSQGRDGGGEGSDENKIICTLPYERMFTSFIGNELKPHRLAEK